MLPRPFPGLSIKRLLVGLILIGYHRILRRIWLRVVEQHLQTQQGRANAQRRAPLIFEDVEADGPGDRGYVGMPHFS